MQLHYAVFLHILLIIDIRELRRTLEEHLNEKSGEIERLKSAFTCGICVTEVCVCVFVFVCVCVSVCLCLCCRSPFSWV